MKELSRTHQVGYQLSWLAMFIRVIALFSAFGILFFHPHPIIAARSGELLRLWIFVAGYTLLLVVMLLLPYSPWLRSAPFLALDTFIVLIVLILAGGGYRNIFSLYSLMPSVTTALSLPDAPRKTFRALLLLAIASLSTVGYAMSLYLDGYTLNVIIAYHQVDEVVLRASSYWVTAGLVATSAVMMIAWQESQDRAAVERERRRIAADMHDGVLSQLSALSRRAEYASLLLAEDPDAVEQELQRIETQAGEVHESIRWIVRALRQDPSQITLSGELKRIADRFGANTDINVRLLLPHDTIRIEVDAIRHLGYIVTEALANVWKHAGVDQAIVAVAVKEERLVVEISDDGVGFDTGQEKTTEAGLGLQNIGERAREIGGRLEIHSTPGAGTRIVVSLPVAAVQEV